MERTYREIARFSMPAPKPVWVEEEWGPPDRRWKIKYIANNPCQSYTKVVGQYFVDGEFTTDYVQYLSDPPKNWALWPDQQKYRDYAEALMKKGNNMSDINTLELEQDIVETPAWDNEFKQEGAEPEGEVVFVQTVEDVGPADETLPT